MKTRLFITAISCGLLLVGCAQKEKVKPKVTKGLSNNGIKTYNNRDSNINTNRDNIDKYGGDNSGYSYDTDDVGISNSLKNIYFGVDKYVITPDKLSIIANNAKILKKDIANGAKVKIEGNCDATGSDEYNYALGLRRAKSAKNALVSKGIKPSAITIVSFGESAPECTTDNSPECYAKNRRVEFKLLQ